MIHVHYPFIFGAELTLLGRSRRSARGQALVVHYKNRLVAGGARGAAFEAYEHTVAPALIRAADRVCVLSLDHADSVSYLRRARGRDPEKLIVMPNGVDTGDVRARPRTPGCATSSGSARTQPWPRSSRRWTAPTTSSGWTWRSRGSRGRRPTST